jgi:hypothetical protein
MYEAMPEMVRPQVPVSPFNTEAPTFKEVQEIVHHKRNAAAPGPNGIPYTVYNLEEITRNLLENMERWRYT